jgi:phage gp37-like protein
MDFEQIEDSIMDALKKDLPYLKSVETYAGQIEAEIEKLPLRSPAAYVVYGGSDLGWVDGPNYHEKVTFNVLLVTKDLRGNKAARKGGSAPGDIGAYQLIKGVLDTLTNRNFDLDIERLQPVRVSLVFMGRTTAVYGIGFQTGFDNTYQW